MGDGGTRLADPHGQARNGGEMRQQILRDAVGQRLDQLHRLTSGNRHHMVAQRCVTDRVTIIVVGRRLGGIGRDNQIDQEFLPEPCFFRQYAVPGKDLYAVKANDRLGHDRGDLSGCGRKVPSIAAIRTASTCGATS